MEARFQFRSRSKNTEARAFMVLGQAYASGRGVKQDICGQKAPPFPTIFGKNPEFCTSTAMERFQRM
jgi:TPR repeat protein